MPRASLPHATQLTHTHTLIHVVKLLFRQIHPSPHTLRRILTIIIAEKRWNEIPKAHTAHDTIHPPFDLVQSDHSSFLTQTAEKRKKNLKFALAKNGKSIFNEMKKKKKNLLKLQKGRTAHYRHRIVLWRQTRGQLKYGTIIKHTIGRSGWPLVTKRKEPTKWNGFLD